MFCCIDFPPSDTYTLSLHDALPIFFNTFGVKVTLVEALPRIVPLEEPEISDELMKVFKKKGMTIYTDTMVDKVETDRKSTRLNSSHVAISYAVFCLKKKKQRIDIC